MSSVKTGDRYEGGWKKGLRWGQGIQRYVNGGRYEGQWKKGEHHGHGILYYADGTELEKEWNDGDQWTSEPNTKRVLLGCLCSSFR